MTDKQKDLWYDDKNDWRRKYDFLVLASQSQEKSIDYLVEHEDTSNIEKVDEDYFYDEETGKYICCIAITTKTTQKQIDETKLLLKSVEDTSYRNDENIWKFNKNIWYWNVNFDDLTIKPKWVKVNELMEAIILRKDIDEYERNIYRGIAFEDYGIWDDYIPRINYSKYSKYGEVKQCKNKPTVYIYENKETKVVDYVGIVTSKKRVLNQRVLEHAKLDNMKLEDYNIKYFYVETKADAEIWEAHLINYYKSHKRLNKSKSNWGKCTFLVNKESEIEWLNYGEDV